MRRKKWKQNVHLIDAQQLTFELWIIVVSRTAIKYAKHIQNAFHWHVFRFALDNNNNDSNNNNIASVWSLVRIMCVRCSCNVYLLASVGAPNENHFTGVVLISLLAAGYNVSTVILLWHFCRFTNELPLLGRCAATRISIEHFYFSHFSLSPSFFLSLCRALSLCCVVRTESVC